MTVTVLRWLILGCALVSAVLAAATVTGDPHEFWRWFINAAAGCFLLLVHKDPR